MIPNNRNRNLLPQGDPNFPQMPGPNSQMPGNSAPVGIQMNGMGGGNDMPPPDGGLQGSPPPEADPNAQLGQANPLASMFGGAGADAQNQMDMQYAMQDTTPMGGAGGGPGGAAGGFEGGMRQYGDTLYNEALRTLNPEWEARARSFEQSLVGQGIDPNSPAGQQARQRFERSRDDAFSSARNQAQQAALGYQQQQWQQGFNEREAQAANRRAMLGNAAAGANRADALRFQERQFNEDTRRYDQGFNEDTRRYDQGFGFQQGRADMSDLVNLMGFGRDTAGFNNNVSMQELQSILPFLNLIPQGGPQGIDVMSPYNLQQQAQQFNAQQQQQRNNGMWNAVGQIGMAALPLMCDARVKRDVRRIGTADNGLPIYLFRYVDGIDDGRVHMGFIAQEVEGVNPGAVVEIDGVKMIDLEAAAA